MIGQSLTQHQLTVCVRVCRTWKALLEPILWKHVEDSGSYKGRRWSPGRDDTLLECIELGCLKTHCHMIQSLRLELSDMDFKDLQDLQQFPPTFPQLRYIELIGVTLSDKEIARFLGKGSPAGWKQIIFQTNDPGTSSQFGKESVKEVLKHAATLEVLRVEGAWCLSSADIQELLCGLPKLKEFFVLSAAYNCFPTDPELKASDLVASRWACENMEVFGCSIGDIPRPSPKTIGYQESIDLQRQVCAQLGRLHKLRKLILKTPYPIYDAGNLRSALFHQSCNCLALSLESGLDLLHNLKDLCKVGLEDMDVDIGNHEEQAWVKEHWPHATVCYPKNPERGPRITIHDYDSYDDCDGDGYDSDDSTIAVRRKLRLQAEIEFYGSSDEEYYGDEDYGHISDCSE
ncbi:hypothetical protein EC991_000504 [Linnemannia zychae]|nr:hypothetical protein EC991_000504 [Linnemannia zychae]